LKAVVIVEWNMPAVCMYALCLTKMGSGWLLLSLKWRHVCYIPTLEAFPIVDLKGRGLLIDGALSDRTVELQTFSVYVPVDGLSQGNAADAESNDSRSVSADTELRKETFPESLGWTAAACVTRSCPHFQVGISIPVFASISSQQRSGFR
jgi:hypothetical protein